MAWNPQGELRKGKPWRARAPFFEVNDKYGPDGKLVSTTETRRYYDWPSKRDTVNVLLGAAAMWVLEYLASVPH